jgi:hypothetical protein
MQKPSAAPCWVVARYATSLTGPVGQSRTVEAVDHRESARSRCSFVVKPYLSLHRSRYADRPARRPCPRAPRPPPPHRDAPRHPPRYLPGLLQLPAPRTQHHSNFTLTMPAQLDLCLRRQASSLLSKASIDEPVTWEPLPGWVTGIPWPGPDPDSTTPSDLHPLIRARLPASAIAARLATTADHVLLTATRSPAPASPATR